MPPIFHDDSVYLGRCSRESDIVHFTMDGDKELNDEPSVLNMLAEKILHQPIKLDSLAYCPTMDLIALATVDEQVHVYRLNGQQVFGVSNKKNERSVAGLQWKPDGPRSPKYSGPRSQLAESLSRSDARCCFQ